MFWFLQGHLISTAYWHFLLISDTFFFTFWPVFVLKHNTYFFSIPFKCALFLMLIWFFTAYNRVVVIPRGASSIEIQEMGISPNNFLVLRDIYGKYHLNGDWHLDKEGLYNIRGTKFVYRRTYNKPESLEADGPLLEDLILEVMDMSGNVRKHTFRHVGPAKIQIHLGVCTVWSESFTVWEMVYVRIGTCISFFSQLHLFVIYLQYVRYVRSCMKDWYTFFFFFFGFFFFFSSFRFKCMSLWISVYVHICS